MAFLTIMMVTYMKENILRVRKMVMVHLFLLLEVDTRENLKMVILTGKESITTNQGIFMKEDGKTT